MLADHLPEIPAETPVETSPGGSAARGTLIHSKFLSLRAPHPAARSRIREEQPPVIPAKAGIQEVRLNGLDSGFRRNDGVVHQEHTTACGGSQVLPALRGNLTQ